MRSLLRDRDARTDQGCFVAEGPRVVAAALEHHAPVEVLYADDPESDLARRAGAAGIPVQTIDAATARRIGDTRTPQPVFAVVRIARRALADLTGAGLSLVCARVNDPGNAGTLLRSAAAAGATAVGLGAGSVDAYNPKVVRASAGACFAIATVEGLHAVEMLEALGAAGIQRLGASAHGGVAPDAVDLTGPTSFVLGHETAGLGRELPIDGLVTIPLAAAESLNVAMAGTILLFEAARQQRSAR